MKGLGTVINVLAVLAGGGIGLVLKGRSCIISSFKRPGLSGWQKTAKRHMIKGRIITEEYKNANGL